MKEKKTDKTKQAKVSEPSIPILMKNSIYESLDIYVVSTCIEYKFSLVDNLSYVYQVTHNTYTLQN